MTPRHLAATFVIGLAIASVPAGAAKAQSGAESEPRGSMMGPGMMTEPHMVGPGLTMPQLNSTRGRKLFASKGCVVCHSVNGVGGPATALDATTMHLPMNPFEFVARMWRGADAMIQLQRDELGEQIELTGRDLADIIAFVHDAKEQKNFSEKDVPHKFKDLMTGAHGDGGGHGHGDAKKGEKKAR